MSRNTLPGGCSEQILHILRLPSRSWGTTFCPLPSGPGPGETGVPGRRWRPRFPSLGRRTGRMLQGQNQFGDQITPSSSLVLIPELCMKKDLPLKASIMACRVSREIPLCPLARTLILSASSMRVLSGLSGFPTPTHHNTSFKTTTRTQNVGGTSKTYHLQSVSAPGSPAAPCRAET